MPTWALLGKSRASKASTSAGTRLDFLLRSSSRHRAIMLKRPLGRTTGCLLCCGTALSRKSSGPRARGASSRSGACVPLHARPCTKAAPPRNVSACRSS
eukprot:scaffold55453_cov57-Phaeocystis_antarctica.AAC.1